MHCYRSRLVAALLAVTVLMVLRVEPVKAQFAAPENVTLTMYQLDQNKGGESTGVPCVTGDISYSCTADSARPYPFITSTITIGIDETNGPDNAYYAVPYLWDVVTAEYGLQLGSENNKPVAGVQAQAIAARTYLYQRIQDRNLYTPPLVVDNSSGFHVFLPYAYEARLTEEAQRQRLQAAMQTRWYITPPSNPLPIVALYGTDNEGMTSAGVAEGSAEAAEGNGYNPRQSIQDPISAPHGTANGAGNGGMSSKGASRWSFGHTSSRGPAGVSEDYCPSLAGFVPDIVGDGQCWSVRYDQAAQILTHYYTGVQVRDANNADANSNLVTPRYRWNPLALDLAYAGCLTSPPTVRLDMQNSGVDSWDLNNVRLFYSVLFLDSAPAAQDAGPVELATEQIASAALDADPAAIIAQGGPTRAAFQLPADRFTHGAGRYRILFDVHINGQNFADLAAAETPPKSWPTLARVLSLSSCQTGSVYLPLVQGDATATTLSQ